MVPIDVLFTTSFMAQKLGGVEAGKAEPREAERGSRAIIGRLRSKENPTFLIQKDSPTQKVLKHSFGEPFKRMAFEDLCHLETQNIVARFYTCMQSHNSKGQKG